MSDRANYNLINVRFFLFLYFQIIIKIFRKDDTLVNFLFIFEIVAFFLTRENRMKNKIPKRRKAHEENIYWMWESMCFM